MGARQSTKNTPTTQTTAQAMDCNGNLFFGTINPPGIGCWDSSTPYNNANLKLPSRNDATLQFVSGMKIVKGKNGLQEIWVLSCRFQVRKIDKTFLGVVDHLRKIICFSENNDRIS